VQESSQPARNKFKRPQCCEQLITILGRTPRDRAQLVSAGGHRPDKSPSNVSPRTPPSLSDDPVVPPSGHQPSKRVHREYSVNSPRSKKSSQTPSVEECLEDLCQFIRESRSQRARHNTYAQELAQVHEILLQDGISETDVVFVQALNLCRDTLCQQGFLGMKSKEGRLNWIKVTWAFVCSNKSH